MLENITQTSFLYTSTRNLFYLTLLKTTCKFFSLFSTGRPIRMESIESLINPYNENIPSNQRNSQPSAVDILGEGPIDVSCKKNISDNSKNSENCE